MILQLFVLVAPFYLQMTVDEVIARGDADLLVVLGLGFALLLLIRVGSTATRSFIVLIHCLWTLAFHKSYSSA